MAFTVTIEIICTRCEEYSAVNAISIVEQYMHFHVVFKDFSCVFINTASADRAARESPQDVLPEIALQVCLNFCAHLASPSVAGEYSLVALAPSICESL